MAAIGPRVLSDRLYGHASPYIHRQALHAWRLGVTLAAFVRDGRATVYAHPERIV